MQNKDDARKFMTYYDSSLGIQLPERSYAETCDLTWENITVCRVVYQNIWVLIEFVLIRIKWISLWWHMLLVGLVRL
jgi:hypothetical protein